MCLSAPPPRVKTVGVGEQTMLNIKALSHATFATVAVLSLFVVHRAAAAQPILVTHGPHGAVSLVDSVPIGATALPTTPSQGYPHLMIRGHGGAFMIVDQPQTTHPQVAQPTTRRTGFPKLMTFGPHGAARIID